MGPFRILATAPTPQTRMGRQEGVRRPGLSPGAGGGPRQQKTIPGTRGDSRGLWGPELEEALQGAWVTRWPTERPGVTFLPRSPSSSSLTLEPRDTLGLSKWPPLGPWEDTDDNGQEKQLWSLMSWVKPKFCLLKSWSP